MTDKRKNRGRPSTDYSQEFRAIADWMIANPNDSFAKIVVFLNILDSPHDQFKNKCDALRARWKKEKEVHLLRARIFHNAEEIAIANPNLPTLGDVCSGRFDNERLREMGLLDSVREFEENWDRIKKLLQNPFGVNYCP